jgi:cyclopropane fatty-acyl-phospholipid synthase-like methyltransferase
VAYDGQEHDIHSEIYWNKQWFHWGENKKQGKRYYQDIPGSILRFNQPRIIELGCGPGYLAENLCYLDTNNKILSYHGFDLSSKAIKMCKEKIKNKNYSFRKNKVEELTSTNIKKYNILVAIDFIEHIKKETFLKLVSMIEESNIKYFFFIIPYLDFVQRPEHINYFSKYKMKKVFGNRFSIKFYQYKTYTEFLTIGKRKGRTYVLKK